MIVTSYFVKKSVFDVFSNSRYRRRVAWRPEVLLNAATQERVKSITISCGTKSEMRIPKGDVTYIVLLRLSTDYSHWTGTIRLTRHTHGGFLINSLNPLRIDWIIPKLIQLSVNIRTWTWLRTIYTAHWCADCGSLLGPIYIIYRLLALSIVTCSPNISFTARLVSENSRSLEKMS